MKRPRVCELVALWRGGRGRNPAGPDASACSPNPPSLYPRGGLELLCRTRWCTTLQKARNCRPSRCRPFLPYRHAVGSPRTARLRSWKSRVESSPGEPRPATAKLEPSHEKERLENRIADRAVRPRSGLDGRMFGAGDCTRHGDRRSDRRGSDGSRGRNDRRDSPPRRASTSGLPSLPPESEKSHVKSRESPPRSKRSLDARKSWPSRETWSSRSRRDPRSSSSSSTPSPARRTSRVTCSPHASTKTSIRTASW